jgi:hypothetical protein
MKLLKIFGLFLCLIAMFFASAQSPVNLVPNGGFNDGLVEPATTNITFVTDQIRDWYYADDDPDEWHWPGYVKPHLHWVGHSSEDYPCDGNSTEARNSPFALYQNKFLRVKTDNDGGARRTLSAPLLGGKKYFQRVWVAGKTPTTGTNWLRIHYTQYNMYWNSNSGNNAHLWDAGSVTLATMPRICDWTVMEKVITIPDGYTSEQLNNIVVIAGLGAPFVDNIELFEYCPEYMDRQNRQYFLKEEQEEAGTISAGKNIAAGWPEGDIIMHGSSKTTYKAYNEVRLLPGVTVERGADFTAKIAPCGMDCFSSNVPITEEFTLCDNECITLGTTRARGMTYSWSATNPDWLGYLSGTNIPDPIFCPPAGGRGPFVYSFTITNACGQTTTKTIAIFYDAASDGNPFFGLFDSNLEDKPDNPSLIIKTGSHTEKVIVDITDCDGNVIQNSVYINGVNFNNLDQIAWNSTEFFDPCGCYKIVVKSKNYCFETWKIETFDWKRDRTLENLSISNVTICKDGKPYLCVDGEGIDKITIKLKNRWLQTVWNETVDANVRPLCFPLPDGNWNQDLSNQSGYPLLVTFVGCDGTTISLEDILTIFTCEDGIVGDSTEWHGDTYDHGGVYTNPETGQKDSVYSVISPNPVTDYSTINYHIPKMGQVKITLLNYNFEQKAVLLTSPDNFPAGDHVMQFSNAELLNGTNYYKIELYNTQSAVHIKRFTSIK